VIRLAPAKNYRVFQRSQVDDQGEESPGTAPRQDPGLFQVQGYQCGLRGAEQQDLALQDLGKGVPQLQELPDQDTVLLWETEHGCKVMQ